MNYDLDRKSTGDEGEVLAAEYLQLLGFKILARNYKLFLGEIDILAEDRKTLVICEVKTVRGSGFGFAQDLVRFKKQNKLRNLAKALEQKFPKRAIRIDVIGVHLHEDPPRLEYIKNAVEGI